MAPSMKQIDTPLQEIAGNFLYYKGFYSRYVVYDWYLNKIHTTKPSNYY